VRHWGQFAGSWTFDPLVGSILLAVGLGYLCAVLAVDQRHPSSPWPIKNTACFIAGVALLWVAILGPFGAYDDVFFWAHMTQHLIITMVAAPLLVLGAPVLLILRVSPANFRRRWLVPVLRSTVARWLTNPVLTWLLFVIVLVGTHFSPFYDYALEHSWIHNFVEHPMYLTAALLFYYPLIGNNPAPRTLPAAGRVISLALMMVPEAFTGFFIYASPYLMYPFYATVDRPFGPGPLADQQLGGALMWSGSMLLDTAWIALAARDWLRADARRTRRQDLSIAREATGAAIRFL